MSETNGHIDAGNPDKPESKPLLPRQQAFVLEYLIDLNGTQAAIRAGYSAESAKEQAVVLLSNPTIQKALSEGIKERIERTKITADRVLTELAAIAFSDIGELVEFHEDGVRFKSPKDVPDRSRRAIKGVKVRSERSRGGKITADLIEFQLWDKVSALDKLAQHLGLIKRDGTPGPLAVNVNLFNLTPAERTARVLALIGRTAGAGQAERPLIEGGTPEPAPGERPADPAGGTGETPG